MSKDSGMAAADAKRIADYEAEDDHRTLQRAAEVTASSRRMAGVKRHHRKVTRQLGAVGRTLGGKRR